MADEKPAWFPEALGDFRVYPPITGTSQTGWTLSWNGEWLVGSYDSRETVLLAMGVFLGLNRALETPDPLYVLQERFNRAVPSEEITTVRLLGEMAEPSKDPFHEPCEHPNGFGTTGCGGCGATE